MCYGPLCALAQYHLSYNRCLPSLSFNIVSVLIKVTILTSFSGPGAPRGVTYRLSELPEKAPATPQEPKAQEPPEGSNTEHCTAHLKPFHWGGSVRCSSGYLFLWEISTQMLGGWQSYWTKGTTAGQRTLIQATVLIQVFLTPWLAYWV